MTDSPDTNKALEKRLLQDEGEDLIKYFFIVFSF